MDKKIKLMVIGAQKAGTTSLNRYLSQHPKIYTHFTQEFGMFRDKNAYDKGFDFFYKNNISTEAKSDTNKSVFVAKRVGLMYNSELLLKVKEHNAEIKVVLVLRNPIERAFSAFWYCKNMGIEPYNKFEDAIFVNDISRFRGNDRHKRNCDYIGRSSYLKHIKNVYTIFPAENIKLFLFEEMITDLNKHLNEMCEFIGLSKYNFDTSIKYNEKKEIKSSFLSKLLAPAKKNIFKNILPMKQRIKLKQNLKQANTIKQNKFETKQEVNNETRAYLKNIFKPEIEELESYTKLPLKNYWPEFFS